MISRVALSATSALSVLLMAAGAQAQTASAGPQAGALQLEEVIVTAERRSTDVQRTPLAITALAGDALVSGGATNGQSLAKAVPSITISNYQPIFNIYIRGTGGGVINQYGDPGVAFNLGGVYIQRPYGTNATFYDLDRVEILKGPQGTLYGRNATAGAINVIPKTPAFKTEGDITLDFGNYGSFESEGMYNTKLSDSIAVRGAFKTVKHDGYLSNGFNDADTKAVRGQLFYKPTDDFSLLIAGDYFIDDSKGPSDVPLYADGVHKWLNDSDHWASYQPLSKGGPASPAQIIGVAPGTKSLIGEDAFVKNTQYGVSATLNWDAGFADLTAIGAARRTTLKSQSYFFGLQIANDAVADQYSLEVRLASKGDGPLKWIAGAFYFDEEQDVLQIPLNSNGFLTSRTPGLSDKNWALFGQATYDVTDKFRVTGGLRYTEEHKTQDGYTIIPFAGLPAATCVAPATFSAARQECTVPNTGSLSFQPVTWKVGAEYDLGPRSLLYANISKGFKAGGFWFGSAPNTYAGETLLAYEIGSKNRFFDNRLQANFDVFYWDYKDQQITSLGNITPGGFATTVKGADSHIYGADAELVFLATPDDRISTDIQYLHGEFTDYVLPLFQVPLGGRLVTLQPLQNFSGAPRPFTPKWAATGRYQHTFRLDGGARVVAGVSTHVESSSRLAVNNRIAEQRPGYSMSDADITYTSAGGRWTVGAYVRNIEDVAVITSSQRSPIVTTPATLEFAGIMPPRTYGVTLSAKF